MPNACKMAPATPADSSEPTWLHIYFCLPSFELVFNIWVNKSASCAIVHPRSKSMHLTPPPSHDPPPTVHFNSHFPALLFDKILIKNIIHVNKCEQLNCFAVLNSYCWLARDLFPLPVFALFFFFVCIIIYFFVYTLWPAPCFVYSAKRGENMNETALSAVEPSHTIFIPSSFHLFSNYLRSVVAISHVNYAKIYWSPPVHCSFWAVLRLFMLTKWHYISFEVPLFFFPCRGNWIWERGRRK